MGAFKEMDIEIRESSAVELRERFVDAVRQRNNYVKELKSKRVINGEEAKQVRVLGMEVNRLLYMLNAKLNLPEYQE